ncbi:hypothetical protein UCDDS831_g06458 [Diplodia seriata]|uniref:Uncharacterized protein n=1 Tax=Diplodia seriata TaxID=420778 RepID=A0A0G2GK19_9PEZI|nr:hypothetical protein UCDDS831_g06458 [Diplodia seriata]
MSAPAQEQISILTIGLDLDWGAAHLGHEIDMAAVRAAVAKGIQEFENVPGLHHDNYFVVPDNTDAWRVTERTVRAGHDGRPWDGITIGWGLRGHADMTVVFERVVNLAKEASPSSKLIFSGPASDHFGAVKRNWPYLKGKGE